MFFSGTRRSPKSPSLLNFLQDDEKNLLLVLHCSNQESSHTIITCIYASLFLTMHLLHKVSGKGD